MYLAHLSTLWLIILFAISGVIIWLAGVKISLATDTLSKYFNFGEAIGGIIFLAIVTNLPEIAITSIAAYNSHLEIAASNILGGIAIQTVVLVLIDCFGVGKSAPLSYKASSISLILEGIVLIFILTLVIIGKQFSSDFAILAATPVEWIILLTWLSGIYLIYKNPSIKSSEINKLLPINLDKSATPLEVKQTKIEKDKAHLSIIIFIVCAVLTLIAGLLLEQSSEALANRYHISNVIFGATILAAVTSLPEISTGIASAKLKDYQMAVSDIIGGNAFLPVLLLLGSIVSGKTIMKTIGSFDVYLTALGILLTGIYMIGLIIKSKRQIFNMGYDSIAILLIYIIGIAGLKFIA
jgi:cation:H+ antiporter